MTKLFIFLSVFLSLSHTSLCQEQTPPEKPKSLCLRWNERDLCGPVPKSCGGTKCDFEVTYPDPQYPNVPLITYSCIGKRGRFDTTNDPVGETCEEIWTEDENGFYERFLHESNTARTSPDLCWRMRDCVEPCVVLNRAFQDIPTNSGPVRERVRICGDSNQQWEEPANRDNSYTVEDVYAEWYDCPDTVGDPPVSNKIICRPPDAPANPPSNPPSDPSEDP